MVVDHGSTENRTREAPVGASAARSRGGRRVLMVFPRYAPSFGAFEYAYPIVKVKAHMPPQGLLVVAAALPATWQVRFVDENIRRASRRDFDWADVVFVSGMHIQRGQIHHICARAHARGKATVLGGPSVSACPEYYPDFDYLHVGELGDATDALIAILDESVARPAAQVVLTTEVRRDLADFPLPAYELCDLRQYLMGTVQFSSGCPYDCEFCDIPPLYGRVPRLKTPAQLTAELDKMLACGLRDLVYFVDDNFIANRRAVRELLPTLIEWQKRNGYPIDFACEATLNIAKRPEILEAMREARFGTVFCGIESPEPEALKAMDKAHNLMVPLLEGVRTLNSYGLEVVAGIILGLDTDTPETGPALNAFVQASGIPVLTINLLQALPKTKLWRRLEAERRLTSEAARESNVLFVMPYAEVLAMWRDCTAAAYDPDALFRRFRRQVDHTYPNRRQVRRQVKSGDVLRGFGILWRLVLAAGVFGAYRGAFWRYAWPLVREGRIEDLISTGVVAHHLIRFARDAVSGRQNASFYSSKLPPGETTAKTTAPRLQRWRGGQAGARSPLAPGP